MVFCFMFNLSTFSCTQCVRHIDYKALEKMTPDIVELIKSTVNLGTKIACAHFICLVNFNKILITLNYCIYNFQFYTQITLRFNQEMTPIVGKLLGACLFGLKDRNNVVRKYSASAIGHLVGVAKVNYMFLYIVFMHSHLCAMTN